MLTLYVRSVEYARSEITKTSAKLPRTFYNNFPKMNSPYFWRKMFIFSRECINVHAHISRTVHGEHIVYAIYNKSELYRSRRAMVRSHVSLFLLRSDNRKCIHVTQSRRELHKDESGIFRAFRNGPRQLKSRYTSTPRTTKHLCVWHIFVPFAISRKYKSIRVVMALRWRRHTTLLNYFRGKTELVRRNLFSPPSNFAIGETRSFFFPRERERERESFSRDNRIWFHGRISVHVIYIHISTDVHWWSHQEEGSRQEVPRTCFLWAVKGRNKAARY